MRILPSAFVATLLAIAGGCARSESRQDAGSMLQQDASLKPHHAAGRDAGFDAALHTGTDAGSTASDASRDAAAHACSTGLPVRCGERFTHSTLLEGRADNLWAYACTQRAETGRETLYAFDAQDSCQVSVHLDALQTDLDLFVLDACDSLSCTQASSTPLDIQKGERVAFDVAAGEQRGIVVDGYAGSVGSYALAVDCLCGGRGPAFSDGAFRLQVDRRWNGAPSSVMFPSMALDEKDFAPVADGGSYDVTVSDGWRLSAIGDKPLRGQLTAGEPSGLHYELSSGTFAGGRFLIWGTADGLSAELTIYGSGVPIVSSERGRLVRSP